LGGKRLRYQDNDKRKLSRLLSEKEIPIPRERESYMLFVTKARQEEDGDLNQLGNETSDEQATSKQKE